ncbi:MAG: hypothetical protein ACI9J3_002556 [Parvicellaceae bacterium]|jgi:hypothetical protein
MKKLVSNSILLVLFVYACTASYSQTREDFTEIMQMALNIDKLDHYLYDDSSDSLVYIAKNVQHFQCDKLDDYVSRGYDSLYVTYFGCGEDLVLYKNGRQAVFGRYEVLFGIKKVHTCLFFWGIHIEKNKAELNYNTESVHGKNKLFVKMTFKKTKTSWALVTTRLSEADPSTVKIDDWK